MEETNTPGGFLFLPTFPAPWCDPVFSETAEDHSSEAESLFPSSAAGGSPPIIISTEDQEKANLPARQAPNDSLPIDTETSHRKTSGSMVFKAEAEGENEAPIEEAMVRSRAASTGSSSTSIRPVTQPRPWHSSPDLSASSSIPSEVETRQASSSRPSENDKLLMGSGKPLKLLCPLILESKYPQPQGTPLGTGWPQAKGGTFDHKQKCYKAC